MGALAMVNAGVGTAVGYRVALIGVTVGFKLGIPSASPPIGWCCKGKDVAYEFSFCAIHRKHTMILMIMIGTFME